MTTCLFSFGLKAHRLACDWRHFFSTSLHSTSLGHAVFASLRSRTIKWTRFKLGMLEFLHIRRAALQKGGGQGVRSSSKLCRSPLRAFVTTREAERQLSEKPLNPCGKVYLRGNATKHLPGALGRSTESSVRLNFPSLSLGSTTDRVQPVGCGRFVFLAGEPILVSRLVVELWRSIKINGKLGDQRSF